MRLIGLTGGIATGKSMVANILEERYNVPVIKVDQVSRLVSQNGSFTLSKIVERFGSGAIQSDGTLNRGYLRSRIIENQQDRLDLEAIVVPAITDYVENLIQKLEGEGESIVVIENALMFEQNTAGNYSEVIVVSCHPAVQLQRVMARDNVSSDAAKGMIQLQFPLAEKERLAQFLIWNNRGFPELIQEVEKVVLEVLKDE